jgi:TP901 family phage tail tape measure protein
MDQYNQDVNINFQGEDNISGVIDKVNEKVGSLQFKIMALNIGLGAFGKQLFTNSDNLAKFTKVLGTTDVLLNKTFAVIGVVKVFSILGTGINDAKANLDGFNDGLKAMQASGLDIGIITQFTQLQDAVLGSRNALDSFSLTALTTFNRFNKVKSEVATLFPENDPFIKNLSTSIQKLVNEDLKNAVTSIDALKASYEAASSGFTEAADNQAVMTAGLKLAKAGGADTGATMKVLAQTISAYNLSAGDATKVSAVLNQTVQLGVTTIPELSNGFAQAAVTANAAKIKLQELGAAVATLTLKGFDTNSALTGIESLSRVIISKTPQAAAALRELRDEGGKPIRFDISEIKADGLTKSLQRLNIAAKGNAEVLREIIPEATAYNTALALMSNNSEKLDEFTQKMFDVSKTGEVARKALDSVFGIKLNNQAETFDAIVNRITEQFIQFGEQLAPFFDTGVKALETFTKTLSGISPEMKKTIASILLGQLAFNKVTDTIGILVGTVTKAFLAYQGLRVTLMFMNGTIGEQVTILKLLWTNNAGLIPILKQLIGIDQSRLLLNAALNKSELDLITTKVANTAATNVNTAAALSNAVTTGKLIEVNGLLGKSYITNNLLTRVLYTDVGQAITTLITKTKDLYVAQIALNKASIASGNLLPTFSAIGTSLTGLGTNLSSLFARSSALVTKLLNGLKLLSAPLIALTIVGALLYDQFFGTTAQVRKLNEELVKSNKLEQENLRILLEKLDNQKMLTNSDKQRLIQLQTEQDLIKSTDAEYKSFWENFTDGVKSFINFTNQFSIIHIAIKGINDLIGKGMSLIRLDQLVPVFHEIDKASASTQTSIINLTESTKKLQSGLSGFEDIDKLIKAGKILNAADIDKINNKAKQVTKQTENEISANETRIKAVNEQLKNYNALDEKQREQASDEEKALANHRTILETANDKLKDVLSKKKEIDKARIEYQTQQNILLKRVLDNNLEIEKGSTTIEGDRGANALQTRMKKGLRLAQTDLEQYRRQVKATLDGTSEYLDANNKKVKIDVTDMTDYVNKFDTNVNGVISSIDQLYQVNGTSATEAAKTLKAVLDTNKQEMNITDYINGINQAIGYMRDGSKVTIDLLNLEGETRRAMLDSGVTSTRETNAAIRKLNAAKLEEEINNQKQLIEFTKATSGADQKKLDAAKLKLLEQQLAAQQRDNLKAELDERFKQQQVALDREQELIKLDKVKRLISEEEYNNKIAEDTKRNLDLKRKQLLQELELNKNDLEKTKSINNQLLGIDVQQQELITSNLERAINVRSKKRELELTREQALVVLNRSKFLTTEEQSIKDIDVVRKKEILNKQLSLNEQLKLVEHDKTKQTEIQNQLLNLQLDYQKIITDNLEREFTKRSKLIENAANRTKLVYRELTNTIDNNVASLNEENKIIDSRNKLTSSTLENESARLTNSLKVTNDIEKRAAIETKIAQLRESNRVVTDATEQRSLINQQKLIELSLQKQQIELDSRRNDANNNSKLIQLELEKAIKQKRNKEDIDAIKIRLDANKQEQLAITKQNELLDVTKRNQSEINSNASRELEIRQRIGREGGLLDLEITKQNEKIARYEKIAQLANLEATIAETNANKMQLAGDLQIKNYQMRLDLLNKQAELEQQHQDNTQRMFKMAEGLAVSDYQKRKLAEQAAKQELLNLNKKHQIERDILAIQIKMNELALIKSELDQKSAEKKLAAELKVQEAETAKVLKSRTATDEEKKGSLATLDAKKFAYQAKLEERPILEQQAELNRYTNTIQKAALDNKQRNETQDKTVAVAKSTFTTADDRAIYRALMNNLRGDRRELDNTRINFSQEKLSNLFSYPNSNVNLERPNFDSNSGKSKSSNSKLNKDVVINFNPTTNIEVKGNADVKEFSKQLNSESDKWIKGLHETLRRVNTELGN